MNILDRAISWAARQRGFVLGPAVVEPADEAFGHDKERFSPPIYGDYITTSSAVYACVTLRQQLLASLPLKVYRTNRAGQAVEVNRGPLVDLLSKVNPFWTFSRLLETTEQTLSLWGECFWFLERGANSNQPPKEIWWGRPDRVSVLPDPVNYIKGFLYDPLTAAPELAFVPDEVIWFRYPNALDEYAPLAPLSAARVAADYGTEAMRANVRLFKNGWQIGGMVMPSGGRELTSEQAKELDSYFTRRFQGQDKAHRWAVLRHEYMVNQMGVNPRDADYIEGMAFALEDVARVYKIPLDLIGGQRTYENYDGALRAVWTHAIVPEARFIETELTEQLLPMFPAQQGDRVAFDTSDVEALKEAETEAWAREREQIETGAMTINEWRAERGLSPLPWGDVWWAPSGLKPVRDDAPPPAPVLALPEPEPEDDETDDAPEPEPEPEDDERASLPSYGPLLLQVRQRLAASVAARLRAGEPEPFEYNRWLKEYREALRAANISEPEVQRVAYLSVTQAYERCKALSLPQPTRGAVLQVLEQEVR